MKKKIDEKKELDNKDVKTKESQFKKKKNIQNLNQKVMDLQKLIIIERFFWMVCLVFSMLI